MIDILTTDLAELKRDLSLRGYDDAEIKDLLSTSIFLIPGPISPPDSESPTQKLTSHTAFLSKDLQKAGIRNRVALRKDIPRRYIDEREAHVDFGTIVIGLSTLQQIGAFADVVQILDFLFGLIRLRFATGRTAELMPSVKFDLVLHNQERMARLTVEGAADEMTKVLTPEHIETICSSLEGPQTNE
jgi:hypothetical protein